MTKKPLEYENLIKYFMKKRNFSLSKLSSLTGIPPSNLGYYVRDLCLPNVIYANRIASVLGVEAGDLYQDLDWGGEKLD